MAINIKNPKAEHLANRLVEKTGETITDAVIHALEDRLERIEGRRTGPDLVTEIMDIATRCSALPVLDSRTPDEILGYSHTGSFT
ncbi:MAG: type II toxin-antitoxin system VapB family antitoxin [Nitrospirales bacterium]|nr:type II toxin-antitoxin system VapB family antitoxin [Nitrospira sp.]MDR4500808.1 type II toxin-antitoxin system VapB family antitoxin [Nitrospirales bacterium]